MGIAFAPADEQIAIAAICGAGDEKSSDDWVRYQTGFGLVGEDWWEMHRTLEALGRLNENYAPLARLLIGKKPICEGPGTNIFLYRPEEVQALSQAASGVTDDELDRAIVEAFKHADFQEWLAVQPTYRDNFRRHLPTVFETIQKDLAIISYNGWAMIGMMF